MNNNRKHTEAGPKVSLTFLLLSTLFCVCLIISNLVEIKTVDLGWFTITAGVIVFPISYIINDCVVEVYGFKKARLMIWMGFISALVVALMLQLAIILPGGREWEHQEAMKLIYGSVPRIMFASFTAFLCGSMVNAYVMSKMKASDTKGRFSLRAILSSLWGESVDSLIFFPIAFGGVFPWETIFSLIVTQALLKTGYEILILPVTIRVVKKLKHHEGDVIDRNISYKWWKLTDVD
ncbi:MAG: queuosine precursor transporter [Bacteroidales bacterium]|nr:queuosine precursor transporter [Bacteroidales bacterium]MBD5245285.1 queuosine precursor transporter [Barnesiella sp.]